MTKAEGDKAHCTMGGKCTCNCCDKRAGKHCGTHNTNCHDSC